MRIAFHVPRAEYLEPGLSGDKVYLRDLMACLRDRGHELKVVSRLDIRELWQGRVSLWRVLSEMLAVRRAMRAFAPEVWLVFGSAVDSPDLFGWWQRPKRYVQAYANADAGHGVPRGWRWIFRAIHSHSLRRADKITAMRPKSVELLRKHGAADHQLSVLLFAVKIWDRIPGRQEARRRLGLPETTPLVLCVSRFSSPRADGRRWKTEWVLDLLDVMTDVPAQINLVLVGDGRGRARIEEGIAQRGLQDRVRMAGLVPYEDLCLYYAACDLSAAYARTERVFNALLESQGCGCPVVLLRTRASEVMVSDGRTGLLANDREEFAAHVAAIALDPARRDALGRAGVEFIADHHTVEVRAAQLEELLASPGDDEGAAVAIAEGRKSMAAVEGPK